MPDGARKARVSKRTASSRPQAPAQAGSVPDRLRVVRQRVAEVLDNVAEGITVQDTQGRVVYANHVAAQMIGFSSPEELLSATGEDIVGRFEIMDEAGNPLPISALPGRQALQGLAPEAMTVRFRVRATGEERVSIVRARPLFSPDGPPEFAVNVFTDITERRRTEEAVRESEERFRALVELAPDVVYSLTPNGTITSLSPAFEQVTGWPTEEWVGRTFHDLVHPDDRKVATRQFQRTLRGEAPMPVEVRVRTRDGDYRMGEFRTTPRMVNGKLVEKVGIARDVTRRVRMEETLRVRARQQEAVARFGQQALTATDLKSLLDEAARLVASTLDVEYVKILELLPDGRSLIVRAGVGWKRGVVGRVRVDATQDPITGYTLEGYNLATDEPVVVEDWSSETRFRNPALLRNHNALSGMSVAIRGSERPFGVLGAHTTQRRAFTRDDAYFLRAIANVLAAAVERVRFQAQIADERARLAGIVGSAMDAIITVDEDRRILVFNAAAERTFRVSADQVIGQSLDQFLPERFRDIHAHHIHSFGVTGVTSRAMGRLGWLTGRRADGEEFPLEATISQVEVGGKRLFTAILRDATERKRTEDGLRLLAEAGALVSASLNYEATLQSVARTSVPEFADWCAVHLAEPDPRGYPRQIAVAHVDPAKIRWAEDLQRRYPPDPEAPTGVPHVIRTGDSEIYPRIPQEMLEQIARDEDHLRIIRELDIRSAILVPLFARGRVLGALSFVRTGARVGYTQEDMALAQEVGRRCGLAVDNAKLFRAEEEARARAEAAADTLRFLGQITVSALAVQDLDALLDEMLGRIVSFMRADSGIFFLTEGETLKAQAVLGEVESGRDVRVRPGEFLTGRVASERRSLMVDDTLAPDAIPLAIRERGVRAALGVPLIVEGRVVGVLRLGSRTPRRFGQADVEVMDLVADRAALVIDRARLLAAEREARWAAQRAAERTERLQAVTAALVKVTSIREVTEVIVNQGLSTVGAHLGSLGLIEDDGTTIAMRRSDQFAQYGGKVHGRYQLSAEVPAAAVVRTGKPLWFESWEERARAFPQATDLHRVMEHQAWAFLPLVANDRVLGALGFSFAEPRRFSEEDRQYHMSVAQQCAQAVDRARLHEAEQVARLDADRRRRDLQTLLDSMGEGMVAVDAALTVRQINAFAARLLGHSADDLVGKPVGDVLRLSHQHAERPFDLTSVVGRCMSTGEVVRVDDATLALSTNPQLFVALTVAPLRSDRRSHAAGAVVLFQDVTRRREVDELRQSIVSLVSHELRTPIHHIKGFTSSLLQNDVQWDDETRMDFLQTIDRESDRLARLVDELLEMSRLESGRIPIKPKQMAPSDLVRSSLNQAMPFLRERTLSVNVAEGLPQVVVDQERMERVLVNLLENAAKYSAPETPIAVSVAVNGDEVVFSVTDKGAGIPEAERERIFEKFVRLHSTDTPQVPGTGLGLAICKAIVERHGGHIWVESEVGKGSTFYFTVPAETEPEPGPGESQESEASA